jgi:hypothetical protein
LEGDRDEDRDDEDDPLLHQFNPVEGLERNDDGIHLFGFIDEDSVNEGALAHTMLSRAFGNRNVFDPMFHEIKQAHMSAILSRLRALPKDWATASVTRSSYKNEVENLAYRAQLGLRSIQETSLGMFHAIEKGDITLLLQLVIDNYALATSTATDCQKARLRVNVPSLSRALEQTDRSALITPGVQQRMQAQGIDEGLSFRFFPSAGRGRGSAPFLSSRGRFSQRGAYRGAGRGYTPYFQMNQQRGGYKQRSQFQPAATLPSQASQRGGYRGKPTSSLPGRGGRGRGGKQ